MGTRHGGRARSPPHISDGRRLVLEGCVFVLFFSFNLGRVCESPQRYAQAKKTINFCQNANGSFSNKPLSPKTPHRSHVIENRQRSETIREKRNTPLQSYTEAVWLRASRSKGFAKTRVSARSRNVATSRATAGGERLATCSGCSCRSSSIVSIG